MPAPNRLAVYLTGIAGLAGGLAPVVGNLDVSSTVGIAAGLAAIAAVVSKWLEGWQAHEARVAISDPASDDLLGGAPLSDTPIEPDEL